MMRWPMRWPACRPPTPPTWRSFPPWPRPVRILRRPPCWTRAQAPAPPAGRRWRSGRRSRRPCYWTKAAPSSTSPASWVRPDRLCWLSPSGGAFQSLLARLCLFRVGAGGTLGKTSLVEEAQDAVGRLGALGDPFLDAVGVQLDALIIVLGQHRVPRADLFQEAAVARGAGVGNDDLVVGTLLGTATGETNLEGHGFTPWFLLGPPSGGPGFVGPSQTAFSVTPPRSAAMAS